MMVAHSCSLVILTWCLALCRDLKRAPIDQSGPHLTEEVTETPRGLTLSRVATQGYLTLETLEPCCPLWQAQISGSIVWILLCSRRESLK